MEGGSGGRKGRVGEGRGGEGRGGREGGGEVGGKEKKKRRGGYLFRKDSTGVQAVPTFRSTRVEVVVHRYLLKISPSIGDLMPEITWENDKFKLKKDKNKIE